MTEVEDPRQMLKGHQGIEIFQVDKAHLGLKNDPKTDLEFVLFSIT